MEFRESILKLENWIVGEKFGVRESSKRIIVENLASRALDSRVLKSKQFHQSKQSLVRSQRLCESEGN